MANRTFTTSTGEKTRIRSTFRYVVIVSGPEYKAYAYYRSNVLGRAIGEAGSAMRKGRLSVARTVEVVDTHDGTVAHILSREGQS